jgi:hypothetical protein
MPLGASKSLAGGYGTKPSNFSGISTEDSKNLERKVEL